ncbi:hypothetical protein N865_02570 [Intrasporangium oryzae NRRL B-24470]|uniref:Uncharacterized protein n=1 Tax=Intrasporangium oryzae NRRL B-24470 TaxID=1386089 RepID=W9GCS4_9MICO|nr:hypothetical protein N865_02570 [Intrasporangium oryzae NRRL B-24470]
MASRGLSSRPTRAGSQAATRAVGPAKVAVAVAVVKAMATAEAARAAEATAEAARAAAAREAAKPGTVGGRSH